MWDSSVLQCFENWDSKLLKPIQQIIETYPRDRRELDTSL